LQQRLWYWTLERQEQHQARLTEDRRWSIGGGRNTPSTRKNRGGDSATIATTASSASSPVAPNSLAEWARTVDLTPLLTKREQIHREKRQGHHQGKNINNHNQRWRDSNNMNIHVTPTKEYLSTLAESIQAPSSKYASNIEAKELYEASKQADQLGEREIAQKLLETLLEVTPNDARVYRRLARMASEDGQVGKARKVLQRGLRRFPDNGFLWHGLGTLELKESVGAGGTSDNLQARRYFAKAIQVDPTLPHPYHALGTLEHTHGRIAAAMRCLKRGIEYCPTNHRLHHALGDIYRGAKLLTDAERSYRRALEHAPEVSHCFAYSALAYVAYEKEDLAACRHWLRKSVGLNRGRHAQGWVSWAQLEESEGEIETARSVCISAISQYERGLLAQRQYYRQKFQNNSYHQQQRRPTAGDTNNGSHWKSAGLEEGSMHSSSANTNTKDLSNPLELKNQLLRSVPTYRSGDRFLKVYRNWARLEERYGTFESVDEVYGRACVAFPTEYRLLIDWASYHYGMRNVDRARTLFRDACAKVGNRYVLFLFVADNCFGSLQSLAQFGLRFFPFLCAKVMRIPTAFMGNSNCLRATL
jgi:tetratricopeptide (TPR) repeat protein